MNGEVERQWISWRAIGNLAGSLPLPIVEFADGEARRLVRLYGDEICDWDAVSDFQDRLRRDVEKDEAERVGWESRLFGLSRLPDHKRRKIAAQVHDFIVTTGERNV